METFDALVSERGDGGKIWASVLKEAIKRRKPDFSESFYGFRTFGNLLEEAQKRNLLEFGRDEKSGAYVYRSPGATGGSEPVAEQPALAPITPEAVTETAAEIVTETVAEAGAPAEPGSKQETRRRGRGGKKPAQKKAEAIAVSPANAEPQAPEDTETPVPAMPEETAVKAKRQPAVRSRRPRKQPEVTSDSKSGSE